MGDARDGKTNSLFLLLLPHWLLVFVYLHIAASGSKSGRSNNPLEACNAVTLFLFLSFFRPLNCKETTKRDLGLRNKSSRDLDKHFSLSSAEKTSRCLSFSPPLPPPFVAFERFPLARRNFFPLAQLCICARARRRRDVPALN